MSNVSLQNKRLENERDYYKGDHHIKGAELLDPSDPQAQLIEELRRLKVELEELKTQKATALVLLSETRKKLIELEAMDEEELVAKVR